ncbi:hypothetical protein VCRLGP8_1430098 [Vibrio crassostreae]|uniref:Uncharacterized protein n=1 Tax=Vibrio crassostreae TaxID=246167 RepID=A0A822MPM9_9VIBR|nr:hypothetical protein EDB35_11479 [Vibrio crassostreae]TCT41286.1 hypothetical protein EDB29_10379 [Vibrio crassostreae]TCU05489.1 hypothetical protein EDB32_11676 [Vibrio crassostreae]CDT09131.1 hypothetical protein VCR5J5_1440084 [Vibrio crassostreae]CDT17509.1 hypothetical protein VCRLGP8_1430098 [Vibrio crassostreae]
MITKEQGFSLLLKLLEGLDVEDDKREFYIELLYRL